MLEAKKELAKDDYPQLMPRYYCNNCGDHTAHHWVDVKDRQILFCLNCQEKYSEFVDFEQIPRHKK